MPHQACGCPATDRIDPHGIPGCREAIDDWLFTRKWYQGYAYDRWECATVVYYLVPLHLTVKIGRWLLENCYYRLLRKLVKWNILKRQN